MLQESPTGSCLCLEKLRRHRCEGACRRDVV